MNVTTSQPSTIYRVEYTNKLIHVSSVFLSHCIKLVMTYLSYLSIVSETILIIVLHFQGRNQVTTGKRKPKTNFVEIRTFLHIYRSFDRMWIFFILALQVIPILRSGFLSIYAVDNWLLIFLFRPW